VSDLNDPRVLFAAERTLLAWSRTAAGLMAFGFFLDRTAGPARPQFALWLGFAFVILGVALCGVSIFHYRRAIASLRPVEIPPGYWVNLSAHVSALMGLLGVLLAAYLMMS
jgi:putative membrane protein